MREQTTAAIGTRLITQNGYARGRQGATDDSVIAGIRNFYKVELWTRDDRIERMLFAGTSLDRARTVFADYARHQACGAADDPATVARVCAMAER